MVIQEMTHAECLQKLVGARLARLACSHENQPYIVPTYLAYYAPRDENPCFYGFTTHGQKVEWMRTNPLVCVEIDDIESYDQWVSVIALGRYEELASPSEQDTEMVPARVNLSREPNSQGRITSNDDEINLAHELLQAQGMWWEPGSAAWAERKNRGSADQFNLIYYKVRIEKLTGHRATPDDQQTLASPKAPAPLQHLGMLRTLVAKIRGDKRC